MSYQSTPAATRPASRSNTPVPQGSDGLTRVAGLPSVASSTPLTREQYVSTAKATEDITRDVASTERYMDGIFAADHAAYASAFEAGRRYTNRPDCHDYDNITSNASKLIVHYAREIVIVYKAS